MQGSSEQISLPHVVLDACVLFPASLRDTLLRAVEERLYILHLSEQIWDEVIRNLHDTGRMTAQEVARLDTSARVFFSRRQAFVTDYEALIPALTNDKKDRHVLAAAIKANAQVIVTFNLRDFPASALSSYGVTAQHPDAFLTLLYAHHAGIMELIIREQVAALMNPPLTLAQVLDTLALHVPEFAHLVRARLLV